MQEWKVHVDQSEKSSFTKRSASLVKFLWFASKDTHGGCQPKGVIQRMWQIMRTHKTEDRRPIIKEKVCMMARACFQGAMVWLRCKRKTTL